MTFREKLKAEHKECIGSLFKGGCLGCPYGYGYEQKMNELCKGGGIETTDADCAACWDREMPNTQEQNTTAQNETEMSTNESGGKQHKRPFRCQAIPPKAAL